MADFIPLSSSIEKLLRPANRDVLNIVKLNSIWHKMPAKVQNGAIIRIIKDGALELDVFNSVWKQEIGFLVMDILRILDENIPDAGICAVKLRVNRKAFLPALPPLDYGYNGKPEYPSPGSPAFNSFISILRKTKEEPEEYQTFFRNVSSWFLNIKNQ
ncbi:hypothetical protein KKF34_14285 [Myxococcota bacterium]|nr:hypothetical protein [Myxococcota bacterium]MBU1380730.1 hypothetical protein [Myxococcota bacterium]MBU1498042.1 hypothetical protein [Myxococcota bacterium]